MRALFLTAMLAVSLVAAGAGVGAASPTIQDEGCSFPYTATDASGQEVTIEQRPERVTTLAPSAAQTMWELDAQSQVVGVTKFALYLDGAESKANVSAEFGADVEAVIGTNPDLVLAPNVTSPETVRSLRDAGLTVFLFEGSSSIQDVRNKTTRIGRLTGNCEQGETAAERFRDRVDTVERVDYEGYLYDLQVGGEPIFLANWLYAHNSMDAPLVMTSRIDPTEIDDEAHNVDVVDRYPLALYEASRRLADPGEVDVAIAEDTLETDRQYGGFAHTHDTSDIAAGPDLSAYKTLGSMEDKMDAQLELARKLRAVDGTDVAERIIKYHFLPDLIGNLRAFSRQETRCLDCGEKYRRMPLTGDCRECGGQVNLTVHEGSVNKYMDVATRVAEEYGCRQYTKQRLKILDKSLESVFENDKNKQGSISDFM